MSDSGEQARLPEGGRKVALITGITGQDGTCLAQLLLKKGYQVAGTSRNPVPGKWRLEEVGLSGHAHLKLQQLNLGNADQCEGLVAELQPTEVYNLGGLSFIGKSFEDPLRTAETTGLGAINLLEAIRIACPSARFFQASTSEIFGNAADTPQDEETPFRPRSPYAVAKLFAHWGAVSYRESFGIFAASGILYNHESPLRGIEFVTRKISVAVARIKYGLQEVVELGNLAASRDWGYAPEYADAMWRTLQADSPGTFVLASGRLTSVREFVEAAFHAIGVDLVWQGQGTDETGRDRSTGAIRVRVSPEFFRPVETGQLCGNPAKAHIMLRWKAATEVDEICRIMVHKDLERTGPGGLA